MAFIPREDLPKHKYHGQSFKLTEDIHVMSGKFERGTLMTVTEVVMRSGENHPRALHLVDGDGNGLLLNHLAFDKLKIIE